MPKESFLFVPYTGANKNNAEAKLTNSDARSHAAAVSRQRRDNKRLRLQLGLHDGSGTNTVARSPIQHSEQPQTSPTASLTPEPHDGVESSDDSALVVESGRRVQRRQHMKAMQFSWRAGNLSADLKITGGLRTDPFGFTPRDEFARSTVDYFMQVISPVNQPIYAIFNVTNIYTTYWLELMQHEDYRPAGVAMVGAIMQKVCNPTSRISQDVQAQQALAVSRLQKKYTEAKALALSDDISIITVLALANLARFLGDNKVYEMHKTNMKHMVSHRGGMKALGHDGLVAASVSQWDSFWTIQKDGEALFSTSRPEHQLIYPAFPLSFDVRDNFVKLPVGFQSLILKGKISVELIDVLGRTADVNDKGIQALSPGNMWHSETRKYRDFLEACPSLATPDAAITTIEKHLTLALLLYCANAFTDARSSTSLFGASRLELTRLLQQEDYSSWSQPELECLYWMCAVCIDSWRQKDHSSALLPKGQDLQPKLEELKDKMTCHNALDKFFTIITDPGTMVQHDTKD